MLPVKLWNRGKEKSGILKCLCFVTQAKIIFETTHTKNEELFSGVFYIA